MENTTKKIEVRLKDRDDVRNMFFLTTDYNVTGYIRSSNTCVNANSILGLFTLALDQPHVIEMPETAKANINGFIKGLEDKGIEVAPVVSYKVKINTTEDVQNLAFIAAENNVSGMIYENANTFDVKDIPSFFSVDLTKPVTLELFERKGANINNFVNKLQSKNVEITAVSA